MAAVSESGSKTGESEARFSVTHEERGDQQVVVLRDSVAGLEAAVCLARGAELCSLKIRNPAASAGGDESKDSIPESLELLFRANDFCTPTEEFTGRAQILFPAVGRNYADLSTGHIHGPYTYTRGDEVHDIPLHGFAKDVPWRSDKETADDSCAALHCSLTSADVSKYDYPFAFRIDGVWKLAAEGVSFTATVHATGDDTVPFSLGNHIAFVYPFVDPASNAFHDGVLRGSVTQRLELSNLGILTGKPAPSDAVLPAEGMGMKKKFLDTVFGGCPAEEECYFEVEQPGVLTVRVEHLSAGLPAAVRPHRYFVMWGTDQDAHGGYICPEPWMGPPNSLNSKKGLIELGPGEAASWGFKVTTRRAAVSGGEGDGKK